MGPPHLHQDSNRSLTNRSLTINQANKRRDQRLSHKPCLQNPLSINTLALFPFTFRCAIPPRWGTYSRLPNEIRHQIYIALLNKVARSYPCIMSSAFSLSWKQPCVSSCEKQCAAASIRTKLLLKTIFGLTSLDRRTRDAMFWVLKEWYQNLVEDVQRTCKAREKAISDWAGRLVDFQTEVFPGPVYCSSSLISLRESGRMLCLARHAALDAAFVARSVRIGILKLWPKAAREWIGEGKYERVLFNSEIFTECTKKAREIGVGNFEEFQNVLRF